jgi:adenylate kinase family enzyme
MVAIELPAEQSAAKEFVNDELMPTLLPALCALARERPADPVTWLAQHLLATKPPNPVQPAVDVVLVLGLDVSGVAGLCADLAAAMNDAGEDCCTLEMNELIELHLQGGTALGIQISAAVKQGKMLSKTLLAQVVEAELADAPGGTYLLQGYPNSVAALQSMREEVGYAPKRALLLELSHDEAMARLAAAGSTERAALQTIRSFTMHSRAVVDKLDGDGILHRIDAAAGVEAMFAAAKKALLS